MRTTHDQILLLLFDNYKNNSLNIDEKLEIRQTLDKIDRTTKFFNQARKRFTFRVLTSVLFSSANSPFIESEEKPIHPVLQQVRKNVNGSIMFAFGQYIPFFKVRLLMHFFAVISNLVIRTNMRHLFAKLSWARDLKKALDSYNKAEHSYQEYEACEI